MKGNTPEQKEYHRIMMNSVNRLSRLLQQVLEFRKAESGNLRLRVSEGDLVAMVGGIIENIMPVMKARGLECTFTHEAEQLKAWFDPDKNRQNTLQPAHQRRKICIAGWKSNDKTRIRS